MGTAGDRALASAARQWKILGAVLSKSVRASGVMEGWGSLEV